MEISGKKLAAWATTLGIVLGVLGFIGIRGGDFFVRVSEGVAVEARISALENEFKEYKLNHDRWAAVQIDRLEDRFKAQSELILLLRGDIGELKSDIVRLQEKIDHLQERRYLGGGR